MDRYKIGNALVVVLLATAMVGIGAAIGLKTILWAADFKNALILGARWTSCAQGLVRCGIERARRDFEGLCKAGTPVMSSVAHEGALYTITIQPVKDHLLISCTINQDDKIRGCVSAELFKSSSGDLHVRGFQR